MSRVWRFGGETPPGQPARTPALHRIKCVRTAVKNAGS
jgi:hypothetical protein